MASISEVFIRARLNSKARSKNLSFPCCGLLGDCRHVSIADPTWLRLFLTVGPGLVGVDNALRTATHHAVPNPQNRVQDLPFRTRIVLEKTFGRVFGLAGKEKQTGRRSFPQSNPDGGFVQFESLVLLALPRSIRYPASSILWAILSTKHS